MRLVWLTGSLALIALIGCSRSQPDRANPTAENLRQIAILCGKYMGSKGKMPPSADALKKFARGSNVPGAAPPDLDQLFVSPRDNEPYVIVSSAKMGAPGKGPRTIIAHEKTGQAGKRYVAYATAEVEEINDEQFKQIMDQSGP